MTSPFEANVEIVGVMHQARTAALTRALDALDDAFGGPVDTVSQASFLLRHLREHGYDIPDAGVDSMVAALDATGTEVREQGAFFSGTEALAEFLYGYLTGPPDSLD